MATCRASVRCSARYTRPNPPPPSGARMRMFPRTRPISGSGGWGSAFALCGDMPRVNVPCVKKLLALVAFVFGLYLTYSIYVMLPWWRSPRSATPVLDEENLGGARIRTDFPIGPVRSGDVDVSP